MNETEQFEALRRRAEDVYSEMLAHPRWYAPVACIESFVQGVECMLDAIAGNINRPDGYRMFLAAKNFGASSYYLTFQHLNDCRAAFIPGRYSELPVESQRLEAECEAQFREHWGQFLAWRNDQQSRTRDA